MSEMKHKLNILIYWITGSNYMTQLLFSIVGFIIDFEIIYN
jgi:hypothetical protein